MAEQETTLKFGIKGAERVQAQMRQINSAWAQYAREAGKAQHVVQRLYQKNSNSEAAKQQVDLLADAFKRVSQNAKDAQKYMNELNRSAQSNLQVSPSPDGSNSPQGPSPSPIRNLGGQRIGHWMKSAAGMAVASIGIGSAAGAIFSGIDSAKDYTVSLSDLSKQLRHTSEDHKELMKNIEQTARAAGISYSEMTRYSKVYSSLSGTTEAAEVPVAFARGMGMDLGATTQTFGQMAQFGAVGANRADMSSFAAMIADAVATGKMQGREQELLRSLTTMVGTQTRVLTRTSTNTASQILGLLTSMNAHGPAGLRGEMGAAYLQTLNSGIMNPGGGGIGTVLMAKALGESNWFHLQYRMEKGIQNLPQIMPFLKNLIPDREQRGIFMRTLFPGTTATQNLAFEELYDKWGITKMNGLDSYLKNEQGIGAGLLGISPDKINILQRLRLLSQGRGSGDSLTKILHSTELSGISEEEKANLIKSNNVRGAIDRIIATSLETDGDRTRRELVQIRNNLTELGGKLLPCITGMATNVNNIADHLRTWLQHLGIINQPPPVASIKDALTPERTKRLSDWLGTASYYNLRSTDASNAIKTIYDNDWWTRNVERKFSGLPSGKVVNSRISQYGPTIAAAAVRNGLNPNDLLALGLTESLLNPEAVSKTGVRGMFQITKDTGAQYGLHSLADREDPAKSSEGAAEYYAYLLKRYHYNYRLADMAWNAGQGTVDEWLRTGNVDVFNKNDPNKWDEVVSHVTKMEAWRKHFKSIDTSPEYTHSIKQGKASATTQDQQPQITNQTNVTVNVDGTPVADVHRTSSGQNSASSTENETVLAVVN
jgi:uncharacterized protein (DUF427 family)